MSKFRLPGAPAGWMFIGLGIVVMDLKTGSGGSFLGFIGAILCGIGLLKFFGGSSN